MKNLLLIFVLLSLGSYAQDSTFTFEPEDSTWSAFERMYAGWLREQNTIYYSLTGVEIPKSYNQVIISEYDNKRKKILIISN